MSREKGAARWRSRTTPMAAMSRWRRIGLPILVILGALLGFQLLLALIMWARWG